MTSVAPFPFDYDKFNHDFPAKLVAQMESGAKDYTKVLGNRTWNHLHALANHYGCEGCRAAFQTMISGIHDLTNVHLGKDIHDPKNFRKFVDMVDAAYLKMIAAHGVRHQEHNGGDYVPDEEFKKVLPVTPENVLKAVSHYEGEYSAPACLRGDTLVTLADGGKKPISELAVGDRLVSISPDFKAVETTVVAKHERLTTEILKVSVGQSQRWVRKYPDGEGRKIGKGSGYCLPTEIIKHGNVFLRPVRTLFVTPEHHILLKDKGWVSMGDAEEGDKMLVPLIHTKEFRQNLAQNERMHRIGGEALVKWGRENPGLHRQNGLTAIKYAQEWQRKNPKKVKEFSRKAGIAAARNGGGLRLKTWMAEDSERQKRTSIAGGIAAQSSPNRPKPWEWMKKCKEENPILYATIVAKRNAKIVPALLQWQKKNPEKHRENIRKNSQAMRVWSDAHPEELRRMWSENLLNARWKGATNQRELWKTLDRFDIVYEKEYPVKRANGRYYYLDTALPGKKVDIEYDGHWKHYTEVGIKKDEERDEELRRLGWRVYRIKNNEPIGKRVFQILQEIAEPNPHVQWARIINIEKIILEQPISVYDLTVDVQWHNYVANGLLVSNSISDLQFLLSIPHGSIVDRAIDHSLTKAPPDQVAAALSKLESQGLVRKVSEGGHVLTDEGRKKLGLPDETPGRGHDKRLNDKDALNDSMAAYAKDVGLITGTTIAGQAINYGVSQYVDPAAGVVSTTPLHFRPSTYLPVIGALGLFFNKKISKTEKGRLGLTVLSANLLAGVIGVGAKLQSGTPFAVVTPMPLVPMAAPQGYTVGATGGVGGFRDLF